MDVAEKVKLRYAGYLGRLDTKIRQQEDCLDGGSALWRVRGQRQLAIYREARDWVALLEEECLRLLADPAAALRSYQIPEFDRSVPELTQAAGLMKTALSVEASQRERWVTYKLEVA